MRIFITAIVWAQCSIVVAQFDRPSDIASAGNRALVVNSGSGEIAVVQGTQVESTHRVGSSLVAIRPGSAAAGDEFLVTDQSGLLRVKLSDSKIAVVDRLELSRPGQLAIDYESDFVAVTSKWGDTVYVVRRGEKLSLVNRVPLSFSPGHVVVIDRGRFLIADAFGGNLALLDATKAEVVSQSKLRGHNVRGLLKSNDEILIAHQRLSQTARTELADVHWGTLMQNVVSRVTIESLLARKLRTSTVALGDVEHGAADPGEMIRLPDGRVAVALSGVNEVLVSDLPDKRGRFRFAKGKRIKVGVRPNALGVLQNGDLLVANELGDSVSVVNVEQATATQVPANGSPNQTAAAQGERAFFAARLSHDGWLSCHSCHTGGHTPGLLADTLGDGEFGNPKLIPSLLGVASTSPFGWSGNFENLPDQINKSVRTTMHGTPDESTALNIAAYLKTLQPASGTPSITDSAGLRAFKKHGCSKCHVPASGFTSPQTYDVGFRDEAGKTSFNPPSLRGVRYRRRFFHDGRATSLRLALKLHIEGLEKQVSEQDQRAIEQFLREL